MPLELGEPGELGVELDKSGTLELVGSLQNVDAMAVASGDLRAFFGLLSTANWLKRCSSSGDRFCEACFDEDAEDEAICVGEHMAAPDILTRPLEMRGLEPAS